MSRRPVAAVAVLATLAALLGVLVGGGGPQASGATFTSSSAASATVRAAADWTAPSVAVRAPQAVVSGTTTITVDASDAEAGIARVVLQQQPAGEAWTTVCTDTAAPYACAWDTLAVADGPVSLRAVATDGSGLQATSPSVTTTVLNAAAVSLASPGTDLRGTVALTAVVRNGTAATVVRIEYAAADGATWKTICSRTGSPSTCSWATTGVPDGDYDLRAVATTGSVVVLSEVVADVSVDNTAPTVVLRDPGSPLRGTVRFLVDATDEQAGVESVLVQAAPAGTTAFRDLCTASVEPYACSYATTGLPDGSHVLRAVATDEAGNSRTSATLTRVVDNTVSSVSVEDPGAFLRGTETLLASANSSAGVRSVRLQRAVSGSTAWTDLCTDTAAPWSCAWDTTTVADGLYDLRAVMTDTAGRTTTSATVAQRRVDNSPLRATNVQTRNGGAVAGRLDAGDVVTFTYSQEVAPATLSPGWDGSPVPVTLRVRDGWLLGRTSKDDVLDVLRGRTAVNLGSVALRQSYAAVMSTATFEATMATATTVVGGVPVTQVTVTAGAQTGGRVRTVNRTSAMVWSPSALVTDLLGRASSAAPVTEPGDADREF